MQTTKQNMARFFTKPPTDAISPFDDRPLCNQKLALNWPLFGAKQYLFSDAKERLYQSFKSLRH